MPVPSILIGLFLAASIAAWAAPGRAAAVEPSAAASPDVGQEVAGEEEALEEVPGVENPFAGRTITSAGEAVRVLLDELGFAGFVSYARIEEPAPDAVRLEGVVLGLPGDPSMRLGIGRIVLDQVDLVGLGTAEGPARFSLTFEAIDYAGLAQGLRVFALPTLPEIEAGQTLTFAVSLLPVPGGEGRMAARFLVQIDRQLGLSFEVTAQPNATDETVALMTFEDMPNDGFALELIDWGFLGAFFEAQATGQGLPREAFLAEAREELRAGLQPMPPGSPSAAAFEAVSARLADLDHPGVLRFAFTTDRPRPLEALFTDFAAATSMDDGDLRFAITYSRLP